MKRYFVLYFIWFSFLLSNDLPNVYKGNKDNFFPLISSFKYSTDPYSYFEVAGLNKKIGNIENGYKDPSSFIVIKDGSEIKKINNYENGS